MDTPPKLGHPQLDAQHADLCHCLGMLTAMPVKPAEHKRIGEILHLLEKMLREHFAFEELLIDRIGLPHHLAQSHFVQHRGILAGLNELREQGATAEYDLGEVSHRVADWITAHLLNTDQALIPYLKEAL